MPFFPTKLTNSPTHGLCEGRMSVFWLILLFLYLKSTPEQVISATCLKKTSCNNDLASTTDKCTLELWDLALHARDPRKGLTYPCIK